MTDPSVEAEWSALVAPYGTVASANGFRFLERRVQNGVPPSPETTFSCVDFYFDGRTTFLDINGVLARGRYHRGLLIGLNGVQLYTYIGGPQMKLVLTNGQPPAATARLARSPFVWLAKMVTPNQFAAVEMSGPHDLGKVVEHHRTSVATRGGTPIGVDEPALESRWRLDAEWEKSDSPW